MNEEGKVLVSKINLVIGDLTIEVTPAEGRKIQTALNELFGTKIQEVNTYPIFIHQNYKDWTEPFWYNPNDKHPIFWSSAGNGITVNTNNG